MINHLDEVLISQLKITLSFLLMRSLLSLQLYEIDFKETNMIKSMVKVGAFPHKKERKKLKILILTFSLALIKIKFH